MPKQTSKKRVLTGVVGYGGAFNMGMHHINSMRNAKGLVPMMICDVDPARAEQGKKDFPGFEIYTNVAEMLKKSAVEMVTVITPHNTHADLAVQCLNAGRHVIVEKPMATTVAECDSMIAAARKNGKMLSVFHNRHWDANILGITEAIRKGSIGDVFRVEAVTAGYGPQKKDWWRSNKKVSGGYMFDWGAHFVEWILQTIDSEMVDISGYLQKRVWHDVTNEDEGIAVVRFKNGAVAHLEMSSIAMAGVPYTFRILGTKGAIVATGGGYTIHQPAKGGKLMKECPYPKAQNQKYYENVRDHLLKGKDLVITAEWGRRVIQVLNFADISNQKGHSVPAKYA